MPKQTKTIHHSPKIVSQAAKTLGSDNSSKLSKSLSGSILGGLAQEKHQTCKPAPKKK